MAKTKEDLSFEEAMEQLEGIVEQLEEGEVPLEKALQFYQKGMALSKYCHDTLNSAEKQLTKMITDEGEKSFDIKEED
ncbi:exodeoxyribonuclease VII small subunit [[Bacillus] enclensis]|jgi:exodeoxyribonuclease VII small subunit|uniref:Exodeoxyribonuclease 7 small subunit n=2 Tax=Rossellomorea TaxID=2837508 RepID=A0A0V8HMJ7_9BACI|nr:exodeoxyribonuclease VII small subunit [[Bacillus] enclensis]OAT84155.1 exodeoxyribonuclease VII small subunit [Bacillus sp. MKU004]QTC43450.1 exodeoxyribonuclease VII small subunit [Bacillus sp. V3]QWC21620.1 exodeoxyribonuclease VII small subunit [Bacillus haikouensis]KSU63594.1 exodeoxyribonuclease VII small subunit [[Bacillus] enclensis]MBH9967390.1 exodeoxyribonuclease VII small subunit [[Bacillus] enclensis]